MSSIIRWSPFFEPSVFDEMDKMFKGALPMSRMTGFMPPMNISQTDDDVIVEISLPGIDPDKVNISIQNDVLTIDGSSKKETEIDEDQYYMKEMFSGSFHRTIALPVAVFGDNAQAEYKDGILTITIPKKEEMKPKTVKVTVKK